MMHAKERFLVLANFEYIKSYLCILPSYLSLSPFT